MAKVSIKPLADRVIVEAAAAEEKTAGGIIIPDTAKEKPQKGKVIAIGTGKKDEPMTVKVGDTVLYGKYAGTEIQVEGKDLLIMREMEGMAAEAIAEQMKLDYGTTRWRLHEARRLFRMAWVARFGDEVTHEA